MKVLQLLVISVIIFGLMGTTIAGTIVPDLEEQLTQLDDDAFVVVIIQMAQKFDVEPLDRDLKLRNATRQQRHYEVITAVQEWADYTQADIRAMLDQKVEDGTVHHYRTYWINNTILAEIQKPVVYELADRTDVGLIHPDYQEAALIEPVEVKSASSLRSAENGLRAINAPQCWDIGITGEGRLTANLDTGVDASHPALTDRWRGNHEPSEECWKGPGTVPSPGSGSHGTHVMGTQCGLGEATGDSIGVAWQAEWIAADTQSWSVSWLNECFEWFADPDGDPETIDDVPDAVNNSWGEPSAPCSQDLYLESIQICEAGGCAVIFAAGNEGPQPETLRNPGSAILTPFTVFSVGAVNGNVNGPPYPIAGFSSRGPSDCDHLTIKPEVSAPGQNVRSSVPGGGYSTMSGTSMACPHTTGVLSLLRQVNPDIEVDEMKEILMITAVDHGDHGEDNTYGWGVIDAYAAVMETFARLCAFEGVVTDSEDGTLLRETRVYVEDTTFETISDVDGFYHLPVQPGEHHISAERFGYYDFISDISYTIGSQETIYVDIQLDPRPSGMMYGIVTNVLGEPIPNAEFTPMGVPVDPFYTDETGYYEVDLPGDYQYTFHLYADNHDPQEFSLDVPADGEIEHNIEMVFVQSFEGTDGEFILSEGFNEWEHGVPEESGGPASAYSGSEVWGTDLNGEYDALRNYSLITRSFQIGVSEDPRMVVYMWYDTERMWDGGNVSISTNDGETWNLIHPDGGYPYSSVVALAGQPGFSGNSEGWQRVEFSLSDYAQEQIKFKFRFASTNETDRGWFLDNFTIYGATDFYVGIDDGFAEPTVATPYRYELTQNSPNPFNPYTLISYQIPMTEHVSLNVYDASGRLVRTLVSQEQPAGGYQVEWNGKNDTGRTVPSGIYFYHMQAGKYQQVRRMVLLK